MGQIERGFNRIYGIERDRSTVQKYGRAFVLAVAAGTTLACSFVVFTLGRSNEATNDVLRAAWPVFRWPRSHSLAAGLALAAMLRWAPYRRQPAWSWLMFGAAFCVTGWASAASCSGSFCD